MKEKILAFLKSKLGMVNGTYLDRVAEEWSKTIQEESAIESTLNETVLNVIKIGGQNFDSEKSKLTNELTKKAVEEYEKKHNIKDGKPVEKDTPPPPPGNDTPEWAKALIESNKAMSEKITALEGQKSRQTKEENAFKLFQSSKVIPDNFKDKWKSRIQVESETPIEDQVKALEDEYTELHKSIISEKAGKGLPKGGGDNGKVSQKEVDAIAARLKL